MRKRIVVALTWAIGFIPAPRSAHAFESDEHRWISNAAACIAIRSLRADYPKPENSSPDSPAARFETVLTKLNGETGLLSVSGGTGSVITYGDISVSADFSRSPSLIFDPDGSLSSTEIGKNSFLLYGAGETLHNPHHFRFSGLVEYVNWHEHAVLLAERAKRGGPRAPRDLEKALALSAYADHFLEDSFAPGHAVPIDTAGSHVEVL